MCNTSNALYVLVLSKQPSFKQTSETVTTKCWITQIIAQRVGPATANARRPYELRLCRGNKEVMTPGRTKMCVY